MKKTATNKSKTIKAVAAPAAGVAKPVKIVTAPVPEIVKPEKVEAAPVAEVAKPEKVAAAPAIDVVKLVQAPPAKKPAVQTTRTVIGAKIDVGFGNALYIRGEGPGLSWDKGLVMDCVADSEWIVTISDAVAPIVFKFLVNDITWCTGVDFTVDPGASITLEPAF